MATLTELIVQLGIKIDDKQLDKMRQVAVGFDVIKDAASDLGRVFTGGRGIKDFFLNTAAQANELVKLSKITTMSTDTIQEWQFAAKRAGVSADVVLDGLKGLQRQFRLNDKGVMQLSKSFKNMSAGGRALQGQMMGLSDEMIYFLSLGPEFIRTAREEAHASKAIMDAETVNKYKEAGDKIETLKTNLARMAETIAGQAAPMMIELTDSLQGFIEKNPEETVAGIKYALEGLVAVTLLNGLTTLVLKIKALGGAIALLQKLPLVLFAMGLYKMAEDTGEKVAGFVNSVQNAKDKLSQKPIKLPPTAIEGGEVILKGPHLDPQTVNSQVAAQRQMTEGPSPLRQAMGTQFSGTTINILTSEPIQGVLEGLAQKFPDVPITQAPFGTTTIG